MNTHNYILTTNTISFFPSQKITTNVCHDSTVSRKAFETNAEVVGFNPGGSYPANISKETDADSIHIAQAISAPLSRFNCIMRETHFRADPEPLLIKEQARIC